MQTIEILGQIGKKAADQGGMALSEILGKRIVLEPSFADILAVHEIHRNIFLKIENVGIMIFSRLREGVQGELIFILDEKTAYKLINLTDQNLHHDTMGALTEMGVSMVKEMGNIVIGSYLTALSTMLKLTIPPPLPTFISGSLDRIFSDVIYFPYGPISQGQRYFIQTDFAVPQEQIKGNLSLALTIDSGEHIRKLFSEEIL